MKPINIHTKYITLLLDKRKYKIDVLGGYGVKLNDFGISIQHTETNQIIQAIETKWPVQSRAYKKRSKRILTIDVKEKGRYSVLFHNSESLQVKKSNLLISSMFMKPIDNNKIEIHFR